MSLFGSLFGNDCSCWHYEQQPVKQEQEDEGWCVLGDVTIHQAQIAYIDKGADGNAYVHTYTGASLTTNVAYDEIAKLF